MMTTVVPAQIRLEEAAISMLLDRIAKLDQEVRDDLIAVFVARPKDASPEEVAETEETIRELLWPELAGDLVVDKAGDVLGTQLNNWTRQIGDRIKNLRTSKGMTQEELAEASNLKQSHISRLESGLHSPSHKTVLALASALKVEVREIDPASE